ncbi:MAG: IS630 family transposase [Thermoplasmata archaeon]|nr:IS630 family transposase [Thermoplasmata archaeon]
MANELGAQPNTCAPWRHRFYRLRLHGLESDAPGAGGPTLISDSTIRAIVHETLRTKPADATHWSARITATRFGVTPSTVHQIWSARCLQRHRLERYTLSKDKHFEEKLRDIVGLYLNPPEHALVLRVDEKTQIQALDRTESILPLRKGIPERQTRDYRRNRTTDLFAALDISIGKITGECHKRLRAKEFLALLRTIERTTPPAPDLHLVFDNLAIYRTARARRWVVRHPRFHFHFVPTSSPWLHQVERWFKEITDKRIRRGTLRIELELIEAVKLYIERYNEVRSGPTGERRLTRSSPRSRSTG